MQGRKTQKVLALAVAMFSVTRNALAVSLYNPLGEVSVPVLIGRIVQAALGISGSLALLMFVYGGFVWLTSGGESAKIEKGKGTLLWSSIGLAVIFGAYSIVNFILTNASGVTQGG
ncbi:hypothetical protein HYV72_00525 [Candidatus Uhrbacteria bacterium]|nr:hypothetical protein [Candidatus Uhrbacteria bacterium]